MLVNPHWFGNPNGKHSFMALSGYSVSQIMHTCLRVFRNVLPAKTASLGYPQFWETHGKTI